MIKKEPIAIVGASCRFPNGNNLREFWNLLSNGQTTVTEMPEERWAMNKFFDPDPTTPNRSYQKHGSFLEDIHDFDPYLFNISPAEAIEMSPSQKLMMELVWEAIEEGGIAFNDIADKKTGVYVGNIWSDFEHERKHKNANTTSHSAVGQSANIIANRVSYFFGFSGPSMVVDTGCSSSLVALHLACQSLWDGGSEAAIVGGINHILDHDQYILLSKFGGLSKKGQCSAFDASADGFVRGEGAGVVLIKKLCDAERDGDRIMAVIKGTAMNNNGYNVNLPATSTPGQMAMLKEAYAGSGIDPSEVQYVEAHGTGTKLGDPTETKALGTFFGVNRPDHKKLKVGSVKTNIGHLEGAAGMAGLIKVLLAMQHKQIPASLHFRNPNPDIPFDLLKVSVNDRLSDWITEDGESMKAGVNSFGWGGTNAHTVLESYVATENKTQHFHYDKDQYLFTLSAKTEKALKTYADRYTEFLSERINGHVSHFHEVCVSTAVRRPHLDHRISFVAANKQQLIQQLQQFRSEDQPVPSAAIDKNANIVFVFPGQGSQWLGMGRTLYDKEPIFKACIDACATAFQPYTNWSLVDELFADEATSRLKEIDVIQPALFAMEVALARLWMSWGIYPKAVVGHSMGEVASAYISSALSLEDAANIICSRSKLMKTVSGKGGAMAVTELNMREAAKRIEKYEGSLSLAVNNSPRSTVIAGNEQDLLKVLEELEAEDLFCRQVKVDVASHSPQMEPLLDPLKDCLSNIKPRASEIPFYSTVANDYVDGEALGQLYWLRNLRSMVRFSESVQRLYNDGHTVFIEMSPHPVLTNAVNECVEAIEGQAAVIPSLLREEPEIETMLGHLGRLYEKGYDVNWRHFYNVEHVSHMELPAYPMQRQTYQLEDRSGQSDKMMTNFKNPLLGRKVEIAGIRNIYVWENKLSLEHLSFVKDHKVNHSTVLPGVSYIEILHAALQDAFGNAYHEIKTLNFKAPVYLQENDTVDTQLKLIRENQHKATFQYFVKIEQNGTNEWVLSADGDLHICGSRSEITNEHIFNLNRDKDDLHIEKEHFYQVTDAIGIQYGSIFRGINWIRINNNRAIAHVVPDSLIALNDHQYFIHPAILDSCFQTIFTPLQGTIEGKGSITTFLSGLKGFKWFHKPAKGDDIIVKATLIDTIDQQNGVTKNRVGLAIFDENGNYLANVDTLEAIIIDNDKLNVGEQDQWLYKVQWEKLPDIPKNDNHPGAWLIFEDHLGISRELGERFDCGEGRMIRVGLGEDYLKVDDDQYIVNYSDEGSVHMMMKDLEHQHLRIEGILHAASLNDHINYQTLQAGEFDNLLKDSSHLLINIGKVLSRVQMEQMPRVIVVTNGMSAVQNKNAYLNVCQAPMWGLAKVLFNEMPALQCQCIDLSYFPDNAELDALYDIMASSQISDTEIVLRESNQLVSRLVTEPTPVVNLEKVSYGAKDTVVVTGFRGAAIPLIAWMADNGARNFALLSRSGSASEDAMYTLEELRDKGVTCNIYKADVSDFDALQKVFEVIEMEMPAIKHIVHAAGVIEAKKISELTYQEYLRILAPKVHGTWNLHQLSLTRSIDTFLLFSSASSLIGLSGQGSYVSANTFVDQLAHYRKQMGLPATAINWGVIEDVGMVANEAELDRYAKAEGFIPVRMDDAVDKMARIIARQPAQMGVCRLDIETMSGYYDALSSTGYFSRLLEKETEQEAGDGEFADSLAGLIKDDAIGRIEELIKQKVSGITKATVSDIASGMTFKSLGIDSLMAIQLRNQIQKVTGITIAVTQFWKYPSIQQFSSFLYNQLEQVPEMQETKGSGSWLLRLTKRQKPAMKLICFHDAGGSSALYENWVDGLDEEIELVAVELPGRGFRVNEQPLQDMESVVEALTEAIAKEVGDEPFAFFGHSMGGAIQFEVLKKLRKQNLALPENIFTSSTPALFAYDRSTLDGSISEDQLVKKYPHLSKANITDEAWRQSLIQILKADLQLIGHYEYQREAPFELPIIALRGVEDDGVVVEQIRAWNEETTGSFEWIERPGGHRYIVNDTEFITNLINETLVASAQNSMRS